MKLTSFHQPGGVRPGLLTDDGVVDLTEALAERPSDLLTVLAAGLLPKVAALATRGDLAVVRDPTLAAPIARPGKVLGIGLNYRDHAIESGMAIPTEPIVFGKFASCVVGPEAPIVLPPISPEVDYEVELVVIIGRTARGVAESEALDYVAGYMVGNDISARDWQLRKPGGQWILGKSFDSFAPTGPYLVTRDEVADPHQLGVRLRLNGELMQNSTTAQLIFGVDALVSYLSQAMTLEPGDLIFTGTPPGVGFARKPPVFLKPGDVCEAEVDGLGTLRNVCRAG
jgi:2-keto-4-pentenoate hydratase/2-oxohepta-3-ene-1,7-dioic acid hydratase in catechol pathway